MGTTGERERERDAIIESFVLVCVWSYYFFFFFKVAVVTEVGYSWRRLTGGSDGDMRIKCRGKTTTKNRRNDAVGIELREE